jgi:hypothetical protein
VWQKATKGSAAVHRSTAHMPTIISALRSVLLLCFLWSSKVARNLRRRQGQWLERALLPVQRTSATRGSMRAQFTALQRPPFCHDACSPTQEPNKKHGELALSQPPAEGRKASRGRGRRARQKEGRKAREARTQGEAKAGRQRNTRCCAAPRTHSGQADGSGAQHRSARNKCNQRATADTVCA